MDKYEQFKESIKEAVKFFHEMEKNKTIRVVSHIDCDGICSAAILVNLLNKYNKKYSLSIYQQLNKNIIDELKHENYDYYIFTDFGSGQLKTVGDVLEGKKILILDHHEIGTDKNYENIVQVNPHLFGIDGGKEIAGSGVVYLFSAAVSDDAKKFAHLAVIGAIGDVQENNGFLQLNDEILKIAEDQGTIEVKKGFKFFGMQTRPVYKVLEYSSDPYVPDVSGSESGAIQFLHQLGIDPKKGNDWKKISDLTDDEMKKLAAGIIMKRHSQENPDDIFGNIYLLPNEEEGTLRDAKEFSTLLNACGRLSKASLGIGACLNDARIKKKALDLMTVYKKELVKAIKWYKDNNNSGKIIRGKKYMIINAETNVPSTMIGTLASMISKSNDFNERMYIMAIAQNDDNTSKVSLRFASPNGPVKDVDLRSIVSKIVGKVGGEAGGHMMAAGAIIGTELEQSFIDNAIEVFEKVGMEESLE